MGSRQTVALRLPNNYKFPNLPSSFLLLMRIPIPLKYRQFLLKAGLVLALLPFFGLSFYSLPYSDDYSAGVLARTYGIGGACQHLYQTWSGRFFCNALQIGLNPLSYRWLGGMFLPVLLGFAVKIGGLWLGLRHLTTGKLTASTAAWLAAGLTLLYLAVVPDVYSAAYYFTDLAVYQLPALWLVVVPVAVNQAHRVPIRSRRHLWLLLASLGTAATAGATELAVVLLGWMLFIGFTSSLIRKQRNSARIWFGLGCLLLIVSGLAFSAPGNYARMQVNATPVASAAECFHRLLNNVRSVFASPGLHGIALVPLLLAPLGVRLLPGRPAGLALPLPLGTALLLVGVVLGCLPYALVWDTPMPLRATNVLLWWLLIGWLLVCWASLGPSLPRVLSPPARLLIAVFLAAIVSLTSVRAWLELAIDAPPYVHQWQGRYALFDRQAQQPNQKLTIAPIVGVTPRHITIHGYDIQPYYNFYVNGQVASWFRMDSVRTDPSQMGHAAF
ncbi:hypothetical protein [Hymenobacter coccineus]|uniref:Glycosyltransferase RgtA/B/C/D-like domain-containing protein n=1 Tax=Hymenobacter coccineus TaxID=1908235 RepID=A0A1G1SSD1_9BACT|nr:hypothetical protein [Hymenobacter coccineus]OGX81527.1 hypothetical protein BEN49_03225 [Hymenobacter coccineus]